jgi:hypothetical protein
LESNDEVAHDIADRPDKESPDIRKESHIHLFFDYLNGFAADLVIADVSQISPVVIKSRRCQFYHCFNALHVLAK